MQVKKRPIEVGQIIDLTIRSNRSTEKGQKDLKMRSCLLGHKGPSHIYCLHIHIINNLIGKTGNYCIEYARCQP